MSFYGEIAGLLTSVCWAFNAVMFAQAGRSVGSSTVNHIRLWTAFAALIVLHFLWFGTPFPFDIEFKRLFYLGISGLIGFVIGDGLLFESYVLIGPRLGTLLMLLAPVFSALLAWIILGEILSVVELLGILVTMGGISWVAMEKVNHREVTGAKKSPKYTLGIFLGIGGAIGQAVGLLFSRIGLEGGYSTISGTQVRVTVASLTLVVTSLLQGKLVSHFAKMKDKKAWIKITAGALSGPVLGVILSLEAIVHTHIGVASTLMSLPPVLLLPVSYFLFKEKVTSRAVWGTVIALVGVVLLFFH